MIRQTLRIGLVVLGLGLATLPNSVLASEAQVDSGGANLRYGIWDKVIGTLPGGSNVEVLGNGYDASGALWHRVQTGSGNIGWVLGKLIQEPTAATAQASGGVSGTATWYGDYFHGRPMANGEIYNMYNAGIAASNIYPLGTWLTVTNQNNGRSVVVRVTDTGSFAGSTIVDLSYAAFSQIADPDAGRIPVSVGYA